MNKITIVTAFFDINREQFGDFARSNDKYFNDFKRWARIKNDLIFFCENAEYGERVKQIREEFGLKNTKIVVLDDITKIQPELLAKMQEIEKNEYFLNFRAYKPNPENRAMYNYVMLMKFYCLMKAGEMTEVNEQIAWMDFGFEHGGATFADENDYAFEWKYDFGDKITMFYIPPIDERPMFEICRAMEPVCVMGMMFVVPKKHTNILWNLFVECETEFANVGLMDDDQPFMLMCSRKRPDIFDLRVSDWFMPLHDFGGEHIKIKPKEKISFMRKVKNKIKRILHKK